MNLGFIIAFIYFIIIFYWVINAFFYFIWLTKPRIIFWAVFPEVYVTIISSINQILLRVFGYLFFIVTVVVLVLFAIWFIIKYLPWPMNYLADIPPLKELNEAGVFRLFERIIEVLLRFQGPRIMFRDISGAIGGFLRKFLIQIFEKYNPTVAEKMKQLPNDELPPPEKLEERPEIKQNDPEKYLKNKIGSVIDKDIEACILKNTEHITPDMSTIDIFQKNMLNRIHNVKCNLDAIKPKVQQSVTNNIL